MGLLGTIENKIGGLLHNPNVQGMAAAALGGVNPLLGLLIGPSIKMDRERRVMENQAMRNKLTTQQNAMDAINALPGMLGPSPLEMPTQMPLPGPQTPGPLLGPSTRSRANAGSYPDADT